MNSNTTNKECARLCLRTFDIRPDVNPLTQLSQIFENEYGRILCNGGLITWKNVNMRHVLGSLYDKYDVFNLQFNNFQVKSNTYGNNLTVYEGTFYISGLPFTNSNKYNTRLNTNSQACLGSTRLFLERDIVNYLTVYNINQNNIISFYKPTNDLCDITIELKTSYTNNAIINGIPEKRAQLLTHMSFLFNIYGINDIDD
jgi:hypothetical protein